MLDGIWSVFLSFSVQTLNNKLTDLMNSLISCSFCRFWPFRGNSPSNLVLSSLTAEVGFELSSTFIFSALNLPQQHLPSEPVRNEMMSSSHHVSGELVCAAMSVTIIHQRRHWSWFYFISYSWNQNRLHETKNSSSVCFQDVSAPCFSPAARPAALHSEYDLGDVWLPSASNTS